MKFECPKCKGEPNMIIKIITEQPSRYYGKMPSRISISPKKSLNSAWIYWGDCGWVCPECRASGSSLGNECIPIPHD